MLLPNGDIVTADIKNCRILRIRQGAAPSRSGLRHHRLVLPRPAAPASAARTVPSLCPTATSSSPRSTGLGRRVDAPTARCLWSLHPPGVSYPSDTNEIRPALPDRRLLHARPGRRVRPTRARVLALRAAGREHAQPAVAGPAPAQRRHPGQRRLQPPRHRDRPAHQPDRLAVRPHRRTRHGPGYLDDPDGVDLAPAHSLAIIHRSTMGELSAPAGAPPVAGSVAPGSSRSRAQPVGGHHLGGARPIPASPTAG